MALAALRPISSIALNTEFYIPSKNSRNRWMWYNGIPSNKAGYTVLTNTTLTTVTVLTINNVTANFSIKDSSGEIVLVNLVASNFKTVTGLTIALNYQEEITVYMDSAMGVHYPKVVLGF